MTTETENNNSWPIHIQATNIKVQSTRPTDFRWAITYPDGLPRLQGAYEWRCGHNFGIEWSDIPTVTVNEKGEVI